MGVHYYVKFTLFDGRLEVEQPEALVYEPKKNGRLELVAVEYITPAEAWHASHAPGVQPAPVSFCPRPQSLRPAAFYELHVRAWKNNPRGEFADWNPNVSCAAWGGLVLVSLAYGD
jgi:hypothetical protein